MSKRRYYIKVDSELARELKAVEKSDVIAALEEVADDHADSDELSEYSSVREIRNDSSISPEERKRRELRWQRVVGRRHR